MFASTSSKIQMLILMKRRALSILICSFCLKSICQFLMSKFKMCLKPFQLSLARVSSTTTFCDSKQFSKFLLPKSYVFGWISILKHKYACLTRMAKSELKSWNESDENQTRDKLTKEQERKKNQSITPKLDCRMFWKAPVSKTITNLKTKNEYTWFNSGGESKFYPEALIGNAYPLGVGFVINNKWLNYNI